jgi:hypothetical protein
LAVDARLDLEWYKVFISSQPVQVALVIHSRSRLDRACSRFARMLQLEGRFVVLLGAH